MLTYQKINALFYGTSSTGILQDICICKKHILLQKINVFPNQSWLFATNFVSTVKQLKSLPELVSDITEKICICICAKLNFNGKRIPAKINID